ncbi:MAG TPA: DUF6722 family protein [Chitinophagales bacterium]|nr:DUF6722 family protein [Chitinophagales bacterium]
MNKNLRKEIGKYFIDVSKLVIGGAVLSTVINMDAVSKSWLLISGLIIATVLQFLVLFC